MINPTDIIKGVEAYYSLAPGSVYDKCRTRTVAEARQISMYICRKHTQRSLSEIADIFHRHHTTVIYALEEVIKRRKSSKKYKGLCDSVEDSIFSSKRTIVL